MVDAVRGSDGVGAGRVAGRSKGYGRRSAEAGTVSGGGGSIGGGGGDEQIVWALGLVALLLAFVVGMVVRSIRKSEE